MRSAAKRDQIEKFFHKWNSCKFNHLLQNIHYLKKKKNFFYNLIPFCSTYPYIDTIIKTTFTIIKIHDDVKYNKNIYLVFVKRMRVAKFLIEKSTTSKVGIEYICLSSAWFLKSTIECCATFIIITNF